MMKVEKRLVIIIKEYLEARNPNNKIQKEGLEQMI